MEGQQLRCQSSLLSRGQRQRERVFCLKNATVIIRSEMSLPVAAGAHPTELEMREALWVFQMWEIQGASKWE